MILKGNQRGGGRNLAAHLSNDRDNDHVDIHELRGFASIELLGAFLEVEASAACTRCEQPFFSVSINPPAGHLTHFDQYEMAAEAIEAKLPGLAGQPRAIIFHEKEGRRHAHVVWSRIDTENGKAVPLSHSRLKLRDVSRKLYAELGIEAPPGIRDEKKADPLNYDRPTWQQAKRLGEDPRDLKKIVRHAWAISDNRASFEAALERQALYLARGDRRGYVVVHHSGEALSLTRYAEMKKADIQARLGPPEQLQTIDQVRDVLAARMTATAEKRLSDMKERHRRELQPLAATTAAMRQTHRAERQALAKGQNERSQRAEGESAKRLRKGIVGLWDRLSGKRGKVSEINNREAAAGRVRDRDERQAVVDRQMTERRGVQVGIADMRLRHKDERTYQRAELAVMLSMMKDSTREQFQDHADAIDKGKGKDLASGREREDGRSRARKRPGDGGPAPH